MSEQNFVPFDQFCKSQENLQQFPLSSITRRMLWNYTIGEIGQWYFSQEEMELLALYLREGPVEQFKKLCLMEQNQNYQSKGPQYFKTSPKRYGPKNFLGTIEDICQNLIRISGVSFEEDDGPLQLKSIVVLFDELLNHLCWGMYLVYQAAGVRNSFQAPVSLKEMNAIQKSFFQAMQMYPIIFTQSKPNFEDFSQKIMACFPGNLPFRFIATLSEKGTRGNDGNFFRLRWGAHELQNVFHAWQLKQIFDGNKKLDAVIAPFFSGLSSGALAYAALLPFYSNLSCWVQVYAAHEDHVKIGEWLGKSQREILARISSIPPLVRPETNVAGKNILIVNYALEKGGVLSGLKHYYQELGAANVYLSAVEAESGQGKIEQGQFSFNDMILDIPPRFSMVGPAIWRHGQKNAANYQH